MIETIIGAWLHREADRSGYHESSKHIWQPNVLCLCIAKSHDATNGQNIHTPLEQPTELLGHLACLSILTP